MNLIVNIIRLHLGQHRMHTPCQKRGPEKMGLGGGGVLSGGAKLLEAWFSRATIFFCKCVISVGTLLLIIHVTMYLLMSLIQDNPWHKMIMALFSHTTIKCCFDTKIYSKCCIIVHLFSYSVLVEGWSLFGIRLWEFVVELPGSWKDVLNKWSFLLVWAGLCGPTFMWYFLLSSVWI